MSGKALAAGSSSPVETFGHTDLFVVRRLRLLVGHFQKEQKRDLLGVSHVGKPVVAQDIRKVPSLVDVYFSNVRRFRSEPAQTVIWLWVSNVGIKVWRPRLFDDTMILIVRGLKGIKMIKSRL